MTATDEQQQLPGGSSSSSNDDARDKQLSQLPVPVAGRPSSCRVCDLAHDWFDAARHAAVGGGVIGDSSVHGKHDLPVGRNQELIPPPVFSGAATVPLAAPPGSSNSIDQQQQQDGSGAGNRADCLGCRLTGLMAGLGGAGYLSSRLLEEPPPRGAHRATLLAASAALVGLGLARGFGWY